MTPRTGFRKETVGVAGLLRRAPDSITLRGSAMYAGHFDFGLHHDQSYATPEGDRSLLTFMVYLNGDLEGGETDFPELDRRIVPETGTAVLFQHMVLHAGRRVVRGTKYVLRTDVVLRACNAAK